MAITIRVREFMTLRSGAAAWPLAAWGRQPAKMLRVALLVMLTLFAAPVVGEAQQSKKIPRLCFLTFDPGTMRSQSPRFDAFFEGLRDLGYVDGQTIIIDYLSADGDGDAVDRPLLGLLADDCKTPICNVL